MSTQNVYFTAPSFVTDTQSQIGSTPNQINTGLINLTGALNNMALNRFVDKYTIDKGIGPYQVDCIPLVVNDTFAMPKFSQNPITPNAGIYTASPSGPYTIQQLDTLVSYDAVVFAPSARTSIVTTPMFKQSTTGEVDNLGSFGAVLEDYRGQYSNTTTATQFSSIFGSTGLGNKVQNFYNVICASGTTTTVDRQAALDSVLADSDFATIKANMKYPFKVFDQVKGPSNFVFENLLDLNGNPLVNTGADGTTAYNTTVTSTTYTTGSNLLPISQNANASTGGKMGLMLFFNAAGMPQWLDLYSHQVASLGYVAVSLPSNPLSSWYCRSGGKETTAQLLVNKTIPRTSTAAGFNGNSLSTTGYYYNAGELYGTSTDTLNAGGNATVGFCRLLFGNNVSVPLAGTIMERYLYQIKCCLNKLGLGPLIDYNNVVMMGSSFGAQCISYMNRIADTGNAVNYTVPGIGYPFLFKPKAFISFQGNHIDFSYKKGMGASKLNETNNRFVQSNMHPLRVPCIFLTGEGDINGFNNQIQDSNFNNQYQTIVQMTKQQNSAIYDTILSKSAIFYRQSVKHFDTFSHSPITPDSGQFGIIYSEGFSGDWLQGWNIPMNPTFPSIQSAYESGLLDERVYEQCVDLNINTLIQFVAHRFLGREYPVPQDAYNNFGLRCDVGPSACDVLTDHEYMRVGPWGMISYDYNYNLTLSNVPGATGASQPPVSFSATGTGQTIAATNLTATSTLNLSNTVASGTGSIAANTPAGSVIFGVLDSQIVVSNSLVNANSIILTTVASGDTSLKSVSITGAVGSFTMIPNATAASNTKVNWLVINSA